MPYEYRFEPCDGIVRATPRGRSQRVFQANPVALVISRDEHYGLANLVALIGSAGGTPIRVFTGCRHAEEWLRSLAPAG